MTFLQFNKHYTTQQSEKSSLLSYNLQLELPRYFKFEKSQYINFKNTHFNFNETLFFLKNEKYKVTLKREGGGVYLIRRFYD